MMRLSNIRRIRRKKQTVSSILLFVLFLCSFLSVGCSVIKNGRGNETKTGTDHISLERLMQNASSEKISIVCTTFPQYDWVRNIIGKQSDRFDLILLLNNGVDMHSYQPTVKDIATIGSSDLFIYIGGESDTWVADALKEVKNKNLKAVNLMDTLGSSVKQEEVVEGMQEGNEKFGFLHDEKGEPEYDEHIWLSVHNAEILVKNIGDAIAGLDKEHEDVYEKNTDYYLEKLKKLDKRYVATIQQAKYKAVLFGDRFPFRYMAEDYHLTYYAAFTGCSAETMAGFETVTFLAKKVDELHLPVILTIENSDRRIAEAIKANTSRKNQRILSINSLQSVTNEQLLDGITYLNVMENNLAILSEALN